MYARRRQATAATATRSAARKKRHGQRVARSREDLESTRPRSASVAAAADVGVRAAVLHRSSSSRLQSLAVLSLSCGGCCSRPTSPMLSAASVVAVTAVPVMEEMRLCEWRTTSLTHSLSRSLTACGCEREMISFLCPTVGAVHPFCCRTCLPSSSCGDTQVTSVNNSILR